MSTQIIDAFVQEKTATLSVVHEHLTTCALSPQERRALTINIYELKAQIQVLKQVRKQIELST